MREVTIGKGFVVGRGRALLVIGGPCAIESKRLCMEVASTAGDRADSTEPLLAKVKAIAAAAAGRQ